MGEGVEACIDLFSLDGSPTHLLPAVLILAGEGDIFFGYKRMLEGGIQGFAEGADDEEPGEDAVLAVELELVLEDGLVVVVPVVEADLVGRA